MRRAALSGVGATAGFALGRRSRGGGRVRIRGRRRFLKEANHITKRDQYGTQKNQIKSEDRGCKRTVSFSPMVGRVGRAMYGASSSRGVSGVGGGWCDAAGELAEEPVVEEGVLACGWASWIDIVVSVDGKN